MKFVKEEYKFNSENQNIAEQETFIVPKKLRKTIKKIDSMKDLKKTLNFLNDFIKYLKNDKFEVYD